jgi:hypothetical protein
MPVAGQGGKHFCEAVESVLVQSMQDIELVFVLQNDPKEHPAFEYARNDKRVTIANVNAPYGEHFPKAYNHGISVAKSDIICFAHDDDVQLSHKAEILFQVLGKRPNVGMVHAGWIIADDNLDIEGFTWGMTHIGIEEYKNLASFSPNAAAVRKSVFDVVKFNESYCRIHEFIWCLEVRETNIDLYYLGMPMFIQRLHTSFSRQAGAKTAELAEYERYRKDRKDPSIGAGKQEHWEGVIDELNKKGVYP